MWQQNLPGHEHIYEEIRKGDLGQVVVAALNIMKRMNIHLPTSVCQKSLNFSEQCRAEGNDAYRKGKHQNALEFYNKALLYAPKDSPALALAYSNRSALLYTSQLYNACLKDIEMCLALDCPAHVVYKLRKRKRLAESFLLKNINMTKMYLIDVIFKKLFDFNEFPRNCTVPYASSDLDFTVESGIPKVVAAKHVQIGSILAFEKAFFSSVDEKLHYTACYYCQNVTPNLIPCDGCVYLLFCSETCKKKCMAEYHDIDCNTSLRNEMTHIVQAAIKLKKLFSSWKDFIEASNSLSLDRVKNSDVDQIFNGKNKFSLLNFYRKRHFWHGRVHNCGVTIAQIIYGLMGNNSFFPENTDEKQSAILAFGRVTMYMSLHIPYLVIMSGVIVNERLLLNENEYEMQITSRGIFPVLGKLPHSCDPNAVMIGLNNRMALVAIRPLTQGEAITVSYAGHRLDCTYLFRQDILMGHYGVFCLCDLCTGIPCINVGKPNDQQMRLYHIAKSNTLTFDHDVQRIKQKFNSWLKALTALTDMPFSDEYKEIYLIFRKFILDVQSSITRNCILGSKH